ncbi:hypothetical protein Acr_07g0008100 [Actinidia rufa]|uniref:Pentatricopeptide repeat (PPR) superfamily protein n=1 Tax=Actinidia rufa TaxID=165716 RepID=A0A7J0EW36_9ERIC|nr:hypothetical protein Acr_07g0008100 [Actinidia rufa]
MRKVGIKPTNSVYSLMMEGYVRAGLMNHGLALVDEYKKSGLQVDEIILTSVVKILSQAGKFSEVVPNLDKIAKLGLKIPKDKGTALIQMCKDEYCLTKLTRAQEWSQEFRYAPSLHKNLGSATGSAISQWMWNSLISKVMSGYLNIVMQLGRNPSKWSPYVTPGCIMKDWMASPSNLREAQRGCSRGDEPEKVESNATAIVYSIRSQKEALLDIVPIAISMINLCESWFEIPGVGSRECHCE